MYRIELVRVNDEAKRAYARYVPTCIVVVLRTLLVKTSVYYSLASFQLTAHHFSFTFIRHSKSLGFFNSSEQHSIAWLPPPLLCHFQPLPIPILPPPPINPISVYSIYLPDDQNRQSRLAVCWKSSSTPLHIPPCSQLLNTLSCCGSRAIRSRATSASPVSLYHHPLHELFNPPAQPRSSSRSDAFLLDIPTPRTNSLRLCQNHCPFLGTV